MASTHSSSQYTWLANQPMQRKILLAVGLLLVPFILAGLLALRSQDQQGEARQWLIHTYEVQFQLDQLLQQGQATQIGARGYMLGRQPSELADFEHGQEGMHQAIGQLRALTSDSPLQQARIDRLESTIDQWLSSVSNTAIAPMRAIGDEDTPTAALQRQQLQTRFIAQHSEQITQMLGMVSQMAQHERDLLTQRTEAVDSDVSRLRWVLISMILWSLLVGATVIVATLRLITRPIRQITDRMTQLAAHDHDVQIIGTDRSDEIGAIARALAIFKEMAIETAGQTWVKTSVSEIAGKLQEVTDYRQFAEQLTSELAPRLDAGVGVFYVYHEQTQRLEMLGSYGYQQRRHLSTDYALGEGLVGQAAVERKNIILQEVPENYIRIHSGTGEAPPRTISVIPLMLRDRLLGVLELASFNHLTDLQMRLLEELRPLAALSLENLGRALRTQTLLLQTQQQADELRASEETLRHQQDDLRTTNQTLQEQSQRLLASEEELRVQTEELQASNEELRQKTDTLNQQKHVLESLQKETLEKAEELARASQYKSEFLANMSHELRTPLNSLLILSRSLSENREGNLDGEQVESARIIHDSGNNLLRLINDILDLSKVEAGKMELVLSDYPLKELERTLQRTFGHVAQEKSLAFEITIDAGLPESIHTDAAKLEQVANNLLGNAFKFTESGAVRVRVGRPTPSLVLPVRLLGKDLVVIAVSDSGIGIPPEKFQKIFHAFEQVDASTSRQFGGTGLGLAIARRISELLGGDIVLSSEEGVGSTFSILIPEQPPESNAIPQVVQQPVTIEPAAPHSQSTYPTSSALLPETIEDDRGLIQNTDTVILIVEDDPVFARILTDMVRRKGHRTLAAADGESGLQLAIRYHPTGILLDVMLPGMDGWTVIERLKAEPTTRHIPVHFISAVDDAGRGRDLGAVGFLTKPVSREAISGAFERLLHFAEGRTRRLLVVDDDADSRAAVRTLLRIDGVDIDEAGSAEEALEHIAVTEYDCVVLDLGLPGMSGMEFLERLSSTDRVPPVVVYSGRDLDREESMKLRQYTDSFVVKGARSPERLLDEVSLFLHSIRQGMQAGQSVSRPALPSSDDLRGRKILLVDDDMRNLFALSKVLRGWGINVSMAQDGQKALKALADNDEVELVLMDIMMPIMDGYDTMRAIRAQPRLAKLPIIALTAKAMRGDREKCLAAGANDYLSKPIDIDKLASMLRVWLHQQ